MATKRDPRVQMAPAYQGERRRLRNPAHKFNLKTLPYQLQPFMIAPVLPGETLQNLLLQARVVTDPLTPILKLIGWWKEYYWFYVKLRDFREDIRDDMANMMLMPAFDPTPLQSAADVKYYHFGGGINYTKECLRVVVEEYFRDEGENWDTHLLDGMPMARIYGRGQNDGIDSLTLEDNYAQLGVAIPTGADASVEDLDYAYQQYAAMRDAGLMAMDFEDWVRQYGVQVREDENSVNLHRPELIRFVREFAYPTNTVEPTTGVPTTAVSWSVAARGDKRVFISEPGFLLGVTCARPKVYLDKQLGSLTHGMDNVQNWLPAAIHTRSDVSHIFYPEETGPFQTVFGDTGSERGGYWLDIRDLMAYGDQYLNYARGSAVPGIVDLPKVSGQRRYPSLAEVQALFNVSSEPSIEEVIKEDGVCNLSILGRQSPKPGMLTLGSGSLVP